MEDMIDEVDEILSDIEISLIFSDMKDKALIIHRCRSDIKNILTTI